MTTIAMPKKKIPGYTSPADYIAQQEANYYAQNPQKGTPPASAKLPKPTVAPPRPAGTPTLAHPSTTAPTPPPPPAPVGPQKLAPRDLQAKLNSMGAGLKVDGLIGPKTRAAMAQFGMDEFGNVTAQQPELMGSDLASQNVASSSTDYQGPDLSGAMEALQGAYSASQPPSSILDDLRSLLGNSPELPTMDINKEAGNRIALQFDPQESALKNALAQINSQYQSGVTQQQTFGSKADASLASIFAALQNDLGQGQQRTADLYGQAGGQVAGAYDQAAQQLQGLNQQVTGELQQSAGGLGLQQALPGPMAQLLGNYQRQAGSNIQNKAISQGGLGTSQANQMALQESQRTGAARQGATARSDIQGQVQAALAQLQLQNAQDVSQNRNQTTQLAQARPLALQQAISELTNQQYEQQRQAQQDRLQQMLGLGGLDIQQQNATTSQNKQAQDLQIAMANLMGDQAKAQSDYQLKKQAQDLQYKDPLTQALKLAQIQNYGVTGDLNTARTNDLVNPQVKPTASTRYPQLLDQFLNTPQNNLWSTVAGPNFRAPLTGTDNNLISLAEQAKFNNPNVNEYNYAMQQLSDPSIVPSYLNQDALRRALSLYYTGK